MSRRDRPGHEGAAMLGAALRLDMAVTDLDDAISRMSHFHATADRLVRQIDDLARALSREWTAAAHDRLVARTARLKAARKMVDKTRASVSRARRVYDEAVDGYDRALDRHGEATAILRARLDAREHQTAALYRVIEDELQRQCLAAFQALKAEGQDTQFTVPEGSYDYIPLDVPRFFDLLDRSDGLLAADPAYATDGSDVADAVYRPVAFLEVGCGTGRLLRLAAHSRLCRFSRLTGFDINPVNVEAGRRAFGLGDDIQVADALTFDYGPFDLIYSFRPFSDNDLQARYEARLAETMHPGAYLLAPLGLDPGLHGGLKPIAGFPDIWRKPG